MATKIRLQRGGHKGYAVYRIVIADSRAPRDGKFTEKIGVYNPNTNPATVDLNFDRALYWLEVGALTKLLLNFRSMTMRCHTICFHIFIYFTE